MGVYKCVHMCGCMHGCDGVNMCLYGCDHVYIVVV